jgi:antigen 43
LHADFSGDQQRREMLSCAQLTVAPAQVEPVWRMLVERAESLGWTLPEAPELVDDPDLCVMAGMRRLKPIQVENGRYTFVIPRGDARLRLLSRASRPSDLRPWIEDRRLLGVMVQRLTWRGGGEVRDVAIDGPLPGCGWWAVEWQVNRPRRWTNGEAALPCLGHGVLELELAGTMRYRIDNAAPAAPDMATLPSENRDLRERRVRDFVPGRHAA